MIFCAHLPSIVTICPLYPRLLCSSYVDYPHSRSNCSSCLYITGRSRPYWRPTRTDSRKEWRACAYHREGRNIHLGQRGAGIQPRTLEIYNLLGILPDYFENGSTVVPRCVYEMPGGVKPVKIFNMSPYEEPTSSVPFVNIFPTFEEIAAKAVAEEPLSSRTRSQ